MMRSNRSGRHPIPAQWIVEYGGLIVECRDEADARRLAARLHRKAYRVSVRTGPGVLPEKRIPAGQIKQWLGE